MGNPPYYPSNMLISILNSSERGKTTNICCAPSLEQEEFGCVYSQNLIVICESPSVHIPYQELCITTLVLQMGKLRHQNLSYIPKIAKLLAANAAQLFQRGKHFRGCLGCGQLLEDSEDNESHSYQVGFY